MWKVGIWLKKIIFFFNNFCAQGLDIFFKTFQLDPYLSWAGWERAAQTARETVIIKF